MVATKPIATDDVKSRCGGDIPDIVSIVIGIIGIVEIIVVNKIVAGILEDYTAVTVIEANGVIQDGVVFLGRINPYADTSIHADVVVRDGIVAVRS